MKVTYLNDGIRYRRNCDVICEFAYDYCLIYHSPEGERAIWLNKKDTIIEKVED